MITDDPKMTRSENSEPMGRRAASLKQHAYVELKRQILSGRLSPGMMLSEHSSRAN